MATLLWLQGQACSGDTISLLNAEQPDLLTALGMLGVELLWHPSLSPIMGEDVGDVLGSVLDGRRALDLLVVEGAVPTGPAGSGRYFVFRDRPFQDWVRDLAARAGHVVAAGTCAAYGGVAAADRGMTGATGLQWLRRTPGGLLGASFRARGGLPVVNVPGCPAHPDWMTETFTALARGTPPSLDRWGRPTDFYSNLAHHGCTRNEFYEFKASAEEYGQLGCLFERLGCRATVCDSDCNIRLWNGRTGSCTRGGFPCIGCTSPGFPEESAPYFDTPTAAGIPTTLPTDVSKAWFVGLAGLTKVATPERLRKGAVSHKRLPRAGGKP